MKIENLDDFILQMPKSLPNIITKARHLYLELGKRSFYDREYENFMFGEENDLSIYHHKPYCNPNIIICTTLNKQYLELLEKLKIDGEIVEDRKHTFVIFKDENESEHVADLTRDLKNIQFGCSTSYFARGTLDSKVLRKIDIYLGYIGEEKGYSNDYWHILRDRLQDSNLTLQQQLEVTLKGLQEFGDLSQMGISELFSLYEKFVLYCGEGKFDCSFQTSRLSGKAEEFFIKLRFNGKLIEYKLNKENLLFEQTREIDLENKEL